MPLSPLPWMIVPVSTYALLQSSVNTAARMGLLVYLPYAHQTLQWFPRQPSQKALYSLEASGYLSALIFPSQAILSSLMFLKHT